MGEQADGVTTLSLPVEHQDYTSHLHFNSHELLVSLQTSDKQHSMLFVFSLKYHTLKSHR